jgi:hypothetical protein
MAQRQSGSIWVVLGVAGIAALGMILNAMNDAENNSDDGDDSDDGDGRNIPSRPRTPVHRTNWSADSHRGVRMGRYYTLWEFTHQAEKRRIANEPNGEQIRNGRELVANVLDPLREGLDRPVTVTSGFRSVEMNASIPNSARDSQHQSFRAADIAVQGLTSRQLARKIIELRLPFDQLIFYDPSRGGHVHVSYNPARNRRDIRFARAGTKTYEPVRAETV